MSYILENSQFLIPNQLFFPTVGKDSAFNSPIRLTGGQQQFAVNGGDIGGGGYYGYTYITINTPNSYDNSGNTFQAPTSISASISFYSNLIPLWGNFTYYFPNITYGVNGEVITIQNSSSPSGEYTGAMTLNGTNGIFSNYAAKLILTNNPVYYNYSCLIDASYSQITN